MFHPTLGRWLTQDPIGFSGGDTNLYRYVENNPVNLLDPTGEQSLVTIRPDSPGDPLYLGGRLRVTFKGAKTKSTRASEKDCEIVQDVIITGRAWRMFPPDKIEVDKETRVIYALNFEYTNRKLVCPCKQDVPLDDYTYKSWGGPLNRAVLIRPNLNDFATKLKVPATPEEYENQFHDGAKKIESTIDPPKK